MFGIILLMFNTIICILAGVESYKHFMAEQNVWGWITLFISALNGAVVLHHVFS